MTKSGKLQITGNVDDLLFVQLGGTALKVDGTKVNSDQIKWFRMLQQKANARHDPHAYQSKYRGS